MRLSISSAICASALLAASTGDAATRQFVATLTGDQMVPPVTTSATGTAVLDVDTNPSVRTVTGTITFSGLTPTQQRLQAGGQCGFNAPTAGELLPAPTGSTITVNVTPSIVEYGQLLGGGGYVKLSSAAHPTGELRGQLYEVDAGAPCGPLDGGPTPVTDAGGTPGTDAGSPATPTPDAATPTSAPSGSGGSSGGTPGTDAGSTGTPATDDGGCSTTSRGVGPGAFALISIGAALALVRRRASRKR